MIKIKIPRKYTLGCGICVGDQIDESQVKAIIEKALLKRGIICEDIIIDNSKK
jgi:hypothetical protein